MQYKQQQLRAGILASAGLLTSLILGGCGGATTTNNGLIATTSADPAVYGLEATGAKTGTLVETSGLGSQDDKTSGTATTGYLTGAIASTAKILPGIAVNGTVPLGFSPGGAFVDGSFASAAPAGGAVTFRAYASNGQDAASRSVTPIVDPGGVVLTSPEVSGFTQTLVFNSTGIGNGPLANGQYDANFTLPFTTTGLHQLVVSIADTSGKKTTTTFESAVVASTDAAVIAQITDLAGNPLPGATATITGQITPSSPATQQTTADAQGVVVLFATPGAPDANKNTNTITVTASKHTFADTPVALTAGAALSTMPAPTTKNPNAVAALAIAANE